MYTVIKNVIMSARFELSDMLRKIDTLWMQADLTDDQRTELTDLARGHADPAMTATLSKRMDDLETRMDKLEQAGGSAAPGEEYPAFVEGRSYHNGDTVTFEGKRYVCTLPEHTTVCVWSPKAYPAYWRAA